MTQICIDEAARRLRKSQTETFELLKRGAFAGEADAKFPTVDAVSLDQYIRNSRPKDQRPLIPSHAEEIAARAAWSTEEEAELDECFSRNSAVFSYFVKFPHSRRTPEAVGKHWWKMRNAEKKQQKKRPWYAAILDVICPKCGAEYVQVRR